MNFKLSLFALLCCLHFNCFADFKQPEDVSQILRQHVVVKGSFRQFKSLIGIPHKIQSSGLFVFWKKKAIHWQTLKPFFQASTFTPNKTMSWAADGSADSSTSNKSAVQKEISRVLLVIMGGDFDKVNQLFKPHWHIEINSWRVDLIPKHSAVSKLITSINVNGSNHVEKLVITSANGDTTEIEFHVTQMLEQLPEDDCHRILGTQALACSELAPSDKR